MRAEQSWESWFPSAASSARSRHAGDGARHNPWLWFGVCCTAGKSRAGNFRFQLTARGDRNQHIGDAGNWTVNVLSTATVPCPKKLQNDHLTAVGRKEGVLCFNVDGTAEGGWGVARLASGREPRRCSGDR